jgi:hypothetical protein
LVYSAYADVEIDSRSFSAIIAAVFLAAVFYQAFSIECLFYPPPVSGQRL